jgi:hypothetical protein
VVFLKYIRVIYHTREETNGWRFPRGLIVKLWKHFYWVEESNCCV